MVPAAQLSTAQLSTTQLSTGKRVNSESKARSQVETNFMHADFRRHNPDAFQPFPARETGHAQPLNLPLTMSIAERHRGGRGEFLEVFIWMHPLQLAKLNTRRAGSLESTPGQTGY